MRGKELVVLIASKKSLSIAVTNNRTAERYGLLLHRLRAMWPHSLRVRALRVRWRMPTQA
jgi:hypothetical protein